MEMIVSESVPSLPGGDMTTEAFLARAPEVSLLNLTVLEIHDIGTASRLVRLAGDDLTGFSYQVGQDLMILADTSDGRIIRRRYTIRRFDHVDRVVDLHIVTDSAGPGARWAQGLRAGDQVEAVGPRGKITLSSAATSHVFVGDDVAMPAIAAMVEALPPGSRAHVLVEIADVSDETKIDPRHDIEVSWTWLHRDGRPTGQAEALLGAVADLAVPTESHAYVFGEASVVSAISGVMAARGVPAERMSAKAYWGRGRANASHGEPLRG
jgi:NADPH-dependent ferric siderophore reductase